MYTTRCYIWMFPAHECGRELCHNSHKPSHRRNISRERERARCISVEFICPAVAEVKWFSKSCPFQHCSLKADLWLRLQFTPFSSLLHPASWTPGSICESWNVIHASSLHPCLPFLISSPFPTYLPVFPPPVPPIYRGDRVIRMWALVSYPINFF